MLEASRNKLKTCRTASERSVRPRSVPFLEPPSSGPRLRPFQGRMTGGHGPTVEAWFGRSVPVVTKALMKLLLSGFGLYPKVRRAPGGAPDPMGRRWEDDVPNCFSSEPSDPRLMDEARPADHTPLDVYRAVSTAVVPCLACNSSEVRKPQPFFSL